MNRTKGGDPGRVPGESVSAAATSSRSILRWTLAFVATLGAIRAAGQGAPVGHEVLKNETVVTLVQAGLGPGTIVAKIRASATAFDVSAAGLVYLKSKGVPDEVIQAMVEGASGSAAGLPAKDPLLTATRLYVIRSDSQGTAAREAIEPSIARHRFAWSLFSAGTQVVLPGQRARVQIEDHLPSFLFQFGDDVQTPSRYVLARFEESDEGSGRRLDLEAAVRFDSERTGPREFKVRPTRPLKKGEYCFYLSGQQAEVGLGGQPASMTVYDFGVSPESRRPRGPLSRRVPERELPRGRFFTRLD